MKIRELIELTHKLMSNHINVVMDISITSSVVDRVFKPRTSQTKDYKTGICCLSAALRSKSRTDWFGMRIMRSSEATCLSICGLLFQ